MKHFAAAAVVVLFLAQAAMPAITPANPALPASVTPSEMWHFDLTSNCYGGAAIGDIDCDGKFEMVFGSYMGDEHLYALNAEDGSLLWKVWAGPGPLDASVKLVDVTGDDRLEVVFATSGSYGSGAGVMHVLHGINGSLLWEYNPGYCTDSPPAVADIDMDGRPEILYGTFHDGINGGYVHIINGDDGSLAEKVGPFDGYIQSGPSVLDLDGDGQLDFVVAMFAGNNRIYAINGIDYTTMWNFQTGDSMYHGCSFADLDEDGAPELVIGNYDGKVYAINGESGTKLWDYDGTYSYFSTAIADVDSDGHFEIVATGSSKITVLNHDKTLLWDEFISGSFRGAAIADIEDDGGLDVIVGDDDGVLTAYEGSNGEVIWSFDAADDYGLTPFEIDNGPIIADLDMDGTLDVFFVGGRGYSGDPENNYGRAYALSTGIAGIHGWSMFRHDYCNSGCYNHSVLGEVFGHIRDAATGESISGARISIDSKVTYSDTSGMFAQFHLPGSVVLNITRTAYVPQILDLEVVDGAIHTIDVMMHLVTTSSTNTPTTTSSTTSTATTTTGGNGSLMTTLMVLTVTASSIVLVALVILRRQPVRSE